MLELRINHELDKLLELRLRLGEQKLQVLFRVAATLQKVIFFKETEQISPSKVALACPVYPLEEHDRTELLHKATFEVEPQVKEISLGLHQVLFSLDEREEELAEEELSRASLI